MAVEWAEPANPGVCSACQVVKRLTLHFPQCHLKFLVYARVIGCRESNFDSIICCEAAAFSHTAAFLSFSGQAVRSLPDTERLIASCNLAVIYTSELDRCTAWVLLAIRGMRFIMACKVPFIFHRSKEQQKRGSNSQQGSQHRYTQPVNILETALAHISCLD